jgi:hypothetical protein
VPYRDHNGIVILETAELTHFFEEFLEARDALVEKHEKEQAALKELQVKLNSPDNSIISNFIDDSTSRAQLLKVLSRFSVYLVSGFLSLMEKCIDATWERSAPSGAFEGYNENLVIILDILTAFPFERFPPALFEVAARGLDRIAYYVGTDYGKSWSAYKTWEQRKGGLSLEIVKELRNVAEQYGYWSANTLLDSIEEGP